MLLGALACRVDVQHHDHVGVGQGEAELAREQGGPRVEMGLEDRQQPTVLERTCRLEGGGDLGRVMGVVVVDERTSRAPAQQLKAPTGPVKAGEALDRERQRRRRRAGRPPARRRR